jgi:DNA-binding NarL/FixJ family response regulator
MAAAERRLRAVIELIVAAAMIGTKRPRGEIFETTVIAKARRQLPRILPIDPRDHVVKHTANINYPARHPAGTPRPAPKTRAHRAFLTALTDHDDELKGRQLGADDYVTKPIDFDLLTMIIEARLKAVARTGLWPKTVALNEREAEVLTWVARGKTSAEIAQILGLTKPTVDFHTDNARGKLGAATRTEAAIKAATGRLIEP